MRKKITLSAEQSLIDRARQQAKAEGTTLNNEIRRWLMEYANDVQNRDDQAAILSRYAYARAGKKFTRDEMNER